MKYLLYLAVMLLCVGCSQKQEVKNAVKPATKAFAYGNAKLKEKFEKYYLQVTASKDSLTKHDFLKEGRKVVTCNMKRITEYDNDTAIYKQVDIIINDTLTINVLEKDGKKVEYVYLYKDKPFTITHKLVEFWTDIDPHFFLDDRECWLLSSGKYLMADTPIPWCGTILQFEFYQVVDFGKMEIIQFVDKYIE